MSGAIVNFATTGNPNAPAAHDWPVYRARGEQLRELNLQSAVVAWPDSRKMDFFVKNRPIDSVSGLPGTSAR
jgi:carboxylesterase type B